RRGPAASCLSKSICRHSSPAHWLHTRSGEALSPRMGLSRKPWVHESAGTLQPWSPPASLGHATRLSLVLDLHADVLPNSISLKPHDLVRLRNPLYSPSEGAAHRAGTPRRPATKTLRLPPSFGPRRLRRPSRNGPRTGRISVSRGP